MNTIYKSILILGAGIISLNVSAQRADSTLSRQVLLERDYNPTLNEATKINTAPNIFSPKIQSSSKVKYLDQAPQLSISGTKLGQVASGDIRTDVPFNKQKVYLSVGAGSHGNLEGTVGARIVDTKNDKLDVSVLHSSTSGNVDYGHSTYLLKKTKAKYSNTRANLNYEHKFKPSILTIGGSYQNMGYNYYGNPLYVPALGVEHTQDEKDIILNSFDLKTKQNVDIINIFAGFKSSEANDGPLKYEGNIAYTNFTSKYGSAPATNKGPRGGIIEADANFYTLLGIGNIGIAGGIVNQSFTSKENYETTGNSNFRGLTNITINPYYKIDDINWDLTVGANVNYVRDAANKFLFTPNIKAQFHINEVNTIYASVTGGVNNNTFVDILHENRYADPFSRVAYSKTTYDIKAGFKSGIIPNFEFDIFAGYKQVKDDHVYAANSFVDESGTYKSWSNVGSPIYGNISTGHIGGLLKTELVPLTTLTAKAVGYFYNVKDMGIGYENKAWGRPTFTAELTADIKPIDKLTLSLSYLLMGGRKGISIRPTYDPATGSKLSVNTASMKDINEFNIRAEYQIVKQFSVYARVNNLFNQKYEQQFGYTLQGMNALGGVSLQF